ncbi:hypothetical protein [Cellvibrio sp. QJXJ]|uniref:hypothetical protein n=1 Tax=Cellvibrio sp. QJXJ TaxID=2964606 RepID=UPI0021C357DE|nr:hypothetical protein [Cellvibrio sp. QJXJ]UUA75231.1 hypothetical protein NNX04_22495 [Cellvibrio sp. QJXJ]
MTSDIKKYSALADRISAQYARLIKEGVNDPQQIFNQMVSFLPELHELWTNTSDYELASLSNKYPDFMNFCKIVEQLSVVQNRRNFRDYDEEQKIPEEQRTLIAKSLGDISRIHETLLEMKQNTDKCSESKLCELKSDLDSWKVKANEIKDQLKQSGASEYAVKTVNAVLTRNYSQANEILQSLENYNSDFIFSYLENNDVTEFQSYFGTEHEGMLVAGRKTINRLERYIPTDEFSKYRIILTALVRDFRLPAIRYTSAIALGLYVASVEESDSVPQSVKDIASTEFVLLLKHFSEEETFSYERDSDLAYSRWNEYLKNPSGFVI